MERAGARRLASGAVAAAVIVLAAACGSTESSEPGAAEPVLTEVPLHTWQIEADGVPEGATVYFDTAMLVFAQECGAIRGNWQADASGTFTARITDMTGECAPIVNGPSTEWLRTGVKLRQVDEEWELLGADGAVVAKFTNDGDRSDDRGATSLPEPPAPLPEGLEPAEREDLLGSWLPESGEAEGRAYLTFHDDGNVSGSDGCNGAGGSWAMAPDGTMLTTTGPSTLIGCENVPVASWLAEARRAGFDGDVLVLVDQEGRPNGRLVRGTPVTEMG